MINENYYGPIDPLTELAGRIAAQGPIPAVRVSSAQARGRAKGYAYWGAVRYEIRLRARDMAPTFVACERASSDRRSERLAERDADEIAEREDRVYVGTIGALDRPAAARVLSWLDGATS